MRRVGAWLQSLQGAVERQYVVCLKSQRARREVLRWTVGVSLFTGGVAFGVLLAPDAGSQPRAAAAATPLVEDVVLLPIPADATVTGTAGTNPVAAVEGPAVTPPPKPVQPPMRGHRGGLVVTSTPAGAEVFINNKAAGRTPLVLSDQAAGSRAIRLTLAGYEPWSRGVSVVANKSTTVSARLTRDD